MRKKLPDKVSAIIQEWIDETGQPVVLFPVGRELQIGVLDGVPDDDEWFFVPVPVREAERLGEAELLGSAKGGKSV